MNSSIKEVQDLLDETARHCLCYVSTHELKPAQYQVLSKFIFGCMNQKHELPLRITSRGSGELDKVLKFIARACQVLLEIDAENENEE